jgi:hypothetical protein
MDAASGKLFTLVLYEARRDLFYTDYNHHEAIVEN